MGKRFTELDHNYMNTGGGCMVSVFTVYDHQARALRYFVCNDEGFNWQTIDNVSQEEPDGVDHEDILIETHDWCALTSEPAPGMKIFDDEEFELFKHCQFEFLKRDCKRCNYREKMPIQWLPNNLYSKLSQDYIDWSNETEELIETDGYDIFPNSHFSSEMYQEMIAIKSFKKWLSDEVGKALDNSTIDQWYDEGWQIIVHGRAVKLPFGADEYSKIDTLLQEILSESY